MAGQQQPPTMLVYGARSTKIKGKVTVIFELIIKTSNHKGQYKAEFYSKHKIQPCSCKERRRNYHFFFRWDMSKPGDFYSKPPMAFTLADVKKHATSSEFCCINQPLLNIPLHHIVLDELHLLLRITDVLLANLIEDAMEWDDREDFLKRRGETKGVHLRNLTQVINSCGVTFSVWEKKDGDGKGTGKMDWTSLMGDERKKLLKNLPAKLEASQDSINHDTAETVIKIWKVLF